MWSQGLSTIHDVLLTAVSGAITCGKISSAGANGVASAIIPTRVRDSSAAALTASISSSGRSAVGHCGDPALSSGTKDGFATWICGPRSSLDALC